MSYQTHFKTVDTIVPENISLPFGLVALVRTCFRRLDLYRFLDSRKGRGVPLSYVIETMCILQLSGLDSLRKWSMRSTEPGVMEELCHGHRIDRKTMERALDLLDTWFEETIVHLNSRMRELYPEIGKVVLVDGSHIERYGGHGSYTAAGEGGGTVQLQDQFMVAADGSRLVPMMCEMYRGNLNDPQQYGDFIPQLMFLLDRGAMIVMDNGGSSGEILDTITDHGSDYLTRVRMNSSDDLRISQDIGKMKYVGKGTGCISHTFQSSERTVYLFFSTDTFVLRSLSMDRKADRLVEQAKAAREYAEKGTFDGLVQARSSRFAKVKVEKVSAEISLEAWMDEGSIRDMCTDGERIGWFKLECSKNLEPAKALALYRHRVAIEHLISSMKSVAKLCPLNVRSPGSTRGALMMTMIAQLCISMVRSDMEPETERKKVDGKLVDVETRPSAKTVSESLAGWTVTVIWRSDGSKMRFLSNENPVSKRVKAVLERYSGGFSVDKVMRGW